MPAVRAEDNVIVPEVGADTAGDGFFTDIGVAGSVNQAALMSFRERLLGPADDEHLAVKVEQLLLGDDRFGFA